MAAQLLVELPSGENVVRATIANPFDLDRVYFDLDLVVDTSGLAREALPDQQRRSDAKVLTLDECCQLLPKSRWRSEACIVHRIQRRLAATRRAIGATGAASAETADTEPTREPAEEPHPEQTRQPAEEPDPEPGLACVNREPEQDEPQMPGKRKLELELPNPAAKKGQYPALRKMWDGRKQQHNVLVAREAARVLSHWQEHHQPGMQAPLMLALEASTCQTGFAFLCAGVPPARIVLVTHDAEDYAAIRRHPELGPCARYESVTTTLAGLGPSTCGVAYLDYCSTLHCPIINDILPFLRRGVLVPGGALAITYCRRGNKQDEASIVDAMRHAAKPGNLGLRKKVVYENKVFLLFVFS